jgi:hypothetical protein
MSSMLAEWAGSVPPLMSRLDESDADARDADALGLAIAGHGPR